MDEDREASKLWRVHKTVYQMVADRGYLVGDHELTLSLEDWKADHYRAGVIEYVLKRGRTSLTFLVNHKDQMDEQLLVFFTDDDTVGIKPIRKVCERMMQQNIYKSILVYRKSLTPSAHKVIQEMAPKYDIAIFMESELMVNITHHSLVPKHVLLAKEEKATLLQR
ncbi:DNA-directed RNA polymerases I, II, and III subunit RPABC1 [Podochytrium sp. JEL0797]|nr:DNA-directed RNA polymerases I, II, and III subunit RPABC1 [Podochytrium sp. JEL0797]